MAITFRNIFEEVAKIRKAMNIPLSIHHLSSSKKLTKADEAFWDYKCIHNLDFPLRYSEMHRLLNVIRNKSFCTMISTDVPTLEDFELIGFFVNQGIVYKTCPIRGNTILSNFTDKNSIVAARTINYLSEQYIKNTLSKEAVLLLQDWICGVPLSTALLYVQLSDSFEEIYQLNPKLLLQECKVALKSRGKNFIFTNFCAAIKDYYNGSEPKIYGNEKAGPKKIAK